MNRIFKIEKEAVVPDGTPAYEIIGPAQSKAAGLPIVEEQRLALGVLDPQGKIKCLRSPGYTYLTWVISGETYRWDER